MSRANGLTAVGASAGSGKTFRLTEEVLGALTQGHVPLEGLVAVTYTKRAQIELASRIRGALLARGDADRAARLPLANVGTVHAACLRLLRELALDAGISPSVGVLPDADRLLRTVLEGELPETMQRDLLTLAARMSILRDRGNHVDWTSPVIDVVTLARHGRIAPSALGAMASRSIAGLFALLPPPAREDLDLALAQALETSLDAIARSGCETAKTEKACKEIELSRRALARGELDWARWCALGKLDPGKKARAAVEPVTTVAARVLEHPALQDDLARFVSLVFEAAERTLDAYARAKRTRNVVDYVDMIDQALTLLDEPAVADDLRERLRLVVVDELQDSSPIQLALFLRLHELAGQSRWVGDPKQCIFEYAGADPALMDATLHWVATSGGTTDRLSFNHRTRPDLVEVCNAIFGTAFAGHAVPLADVRVTPRRTLPHELASTPPLGVWALNTKKKEDDAVAIAEGIRRLLAQPSETRVVDRATGAVRPLRAGDIAVLVATNGEAENVAGALAAHRIGVAVSRAGLLATPEGTALEAALALLVDPDAGREQAILEALHEFEGEDPDAWLSARVRAAAARRAARSEGRDPEPNGAPATTWRRRLDQVRERGAILSPAETVDAVLTALDLAALCARWPDATQRLANVDALRALARAYEARCTELAEGASLGGLLRHFAELATPVIFRGEELASDAQAEARGDHAVTVLTYHRSKGLEWPVVILASLDRAGRRSAFDVVPECDHDTLDPDAPLRGRWIRYWPWPFGPNASHPLKDRAATSPEGARVDLREARERVRLLYVGFTRARDHLILALRPGHSKWLDELRASDGRPAIVLPGARSETLQILCPDGRAADVAIRWTDLEPTRPGAPEEHPTSWFDRIERAIVPGGYRIAPSSAAEACAQLPRLAIRQLSRIHPPLLLGAAPDASWNDVGSAIHAFLAADVEGLEEGERQTRARRLLEGVGLGADEEVARVVGAADALRAWVTTKHPGATWKREVPVRAKVEDVTGEREIVGTIDLLLELPGADGKRVVIVDHKSDRVLAEAAWRAQATRHAPQLAAYALAVEAAGREVVGCVVHFAVGGGVVELGASRAS